MKKYKITELGETSEYKKDQIITEKDFPIYWIELGIKIGCIEEVKEEGNRWRARNGEDFYYIGAYGKCNLRTERYLPETDYLYITGNYFKTPEQAQQKLDRDLAIARVNDRIRELQGGEISMEELMDNIKPKYYIHYIMSNKEYDYFTWSNYHQSIFLSIRTWEIAKQIIKEHKNDLDIIWGINK